MSKVRTHLEFAEKFRRDIYALPPTGADSIKVYNPLDYAWNSYAEYVKRFGETEKEAIFVGMNPSPHGMAQTGIPLGDIMSVNWIGINELVSCKKDDFFSIKGFQYERPEKSGSNFWTFIKSQFGNAEKFFEKYFVINYCPLLFIDTSGQNFGSVPLNKVLPMLSSKYVSKLHEICIEYLSNIERLLSLERIFALGKDVEGYLKEKFSEKVIYITHPSHDQNDWVYDVTDQLAPFIEEISPIEKISLKVKQSKGETTR